jgi:hypothetical protein
VEVKSVGITKTIDGLGPRFLNGLGVGRPLEDNIYRKCACALGCSEVSVGDIPSIFDVPELHQLPT